MKAVTVFGSGTVRPSSASWADAFEIGKLLAESKLTVVNGGYAGVMEASAKGAKASGGHTIGVTAGEFEGSTANSCLDKELRMPTWRERLHKLVELGDGFVVLDGGIGTLTELMVVLEMHKNGLHRKPIAVLGAEINRLLEAMKRNPEIRYPQNLFQASRPGEAVDFLLEQLSG